MDTSKSKEILGFIKQDRIPVNELDELRAINMGIDALNFLELARHYHWAGSEKLLPGETEETPTPQSSTPSHNPLQGGRNEYAGKLKPNE